VVHGNGELAADEFPPADEVVQKFQDGEDVHAVGEDVDADGAEEEQVPQSNASHVDADGDEDVDADADADTDALVASQ
jgi:hypothetical protein